MSAAMTERIPTGPDRGDEAFYRKILDNVDDGIYFVDRDRRITFWNRAAERLTGWDPSAIW